MPYDDSIPQNNEGDEVLTVSITPIYSDSILEIVFSSIITTDATATSITVALFQDSTASALQARAYSNSVLQLCRIGFLRHIMVSGTTSATTFKIRIGPDASSAYVNGDTLGTRLMGGISNTTLTVKEYLA